MSDTHEALDLDAIEARANAATPGPWDTDEYDGGLRSTVTAGPITSDEDYDFIAHARTDVPALIAEVRRLRAIEARLKHAMTHGYEYASEGVVVTPNVVAFIRCILTGEEPK
ncbi:MAG: hypothetical protein ACYDCJ_12435 [Gammaproteobacteria bacterium]